MFEGDGRFQIAIRLCDVERDDIEVLGPVIRKWRIL
jgi:hypothetical protein